MKIITAAKTVLQGMNLKIPVSYTDEKYQEKLDSFKLSRTSFGKKALDCSKDGAMAIDEVADSYMQVDQGNLWSGFYILCIQLIRSRFGNTTYEFLVGTSSQQHRARSTFSKLPYLFSYVV